MSPRRQAAVGLSLAAAIVSGWLFLHVVGVFLLRLNDPVTLAAAPAVVLVETWFGAGLFIVAHDAMHGSLAPGRRRLERTVGQVALGLYCGFPYGALERAHHAHHRHAGAGGDPDFHEQDPRAFWPWYAAFVRTYFGWPQLLALAATGAVYVGLLHARPLNVVVFWMLPAIASSLQLFTFGTWLPHRHTDGAFADRHRARTLDFGELASLLACFHFGYHLEHHRAPGLPWWRLPSYRRAAAPQPSSSVKPAATIA